MNRKSWLGASGLCWAAMAGVVSIWACTSSSGNQGGSPTFPSSTQDATFPSSSSGGTSSGGQTFNLTACLSGIAGTNIDAGACPTVSACIQSQCSADLTAAYGSGWMNGVISTSAPCSGFASCVMGSASCTQAAAQTCFTSNAACDCPMQILAQCASTKCADATCSTSLLASVPTDPTSVDCSGTCVDEQTDSSNCGACGHACTGGQTCQAGACACLAPAVSCSGTCVDEQTSLSNCGACGTACATGAACTAGACVCPTTNPDACGASCTNKQTDSSNCGTCGNVCLTGQACASGTCTSTTSCLNTAPTCGGSVINSCTSQDYCGASGNCQGANAGMVCDNPIGATCIAGVCGCQPGQGNVSGYCTDCASMNMILCGTACVSPTSSQTNCGASGNCQGANAGVNCTGGNCTSGVCSCPVGTGEILCASGCIDPATSSTNCGATGNCQGTNAGIACTSGAICNGTTCVSTPANPCGYSGCTTAPNNEGYGFMCCPNAADGGVECNAVNTGGTSSCSNQCGISGKPCCPGNTCGTIDPTNSMGITCTAGAGQ
jgi:hypothetical protein